MQTSIQPAGVAQRIRDRAAGENVRRLLVWLGAATTVVMAIVLLQGTLVTNTGSQAGCGDSWPMCRGKIIPELTGVAGAATLIEFSHRIVVPIVSTMILALAGGVWWLWRSRLEARLLAPAMIVFLFLQAILGGLAVKYPTSPEILALHFGISLLAFSSVLLTAAFVREASGGDALRDHPLGSAQRWLIFGTFAFTYVEVYLGAYVRHVGASLACLDWPLCNGALVPHFGYDVGPQFVHRLGAATLTTLIAALWWQARRMRRERPDLHAAARAALALVLLQAASGGVVVVSRLAVLSTLLHSFLVTLLFGTLSFMCYRAIPRPVAARAASRERSE